ncbi:MAG: hypothetical protein JXQ75_13450 [Phycisphaerae bacterium]|nr:hypothetical protein [Phycisphaerae bacterium]
MKTNDKTFNERVVKMVETCDGVVARTFYCIHDPDFGHWMSSEPFDGLIWTKDVSCRQEFDSRDEAEAELDSFLDWRREQEAEGGTAADIPWEREAA